MPQQQRSKFGMTSILPDASSALVGIVFTAPLHQQRPLPPLQPTSKMFITEEEVKGWCHPQRCWRGHPSHKHRTRGGSIVDLVLAPESYKRSASLKQRAGTKVKSHRINKGEGRSKQQVWFCWESLAGVPPPLPRVEDFGSVSQAEQASWVGG